MRKFFILAAAILVANPSAMAQGTQAQKQINWNSYSNKQKNATMHRQTDDKVYDVVEQQPSFPGGPAAMHSWLRENIEYPAEAVKNGIEGRVTVKFIVEKDGSISNPKVVKPVEPSLDKEAIRVISRMPKWNPGRQNGRAMRVKYFIPVTFRLQ